MKPFDLKKYLTEGKLLKENNIPPPEPDNLVDYFKNIENSTEIWKFLQYSTLEELQYIYEILFGYTANGMSKDELVRELYGYWEDPSMFD